MAAITLEQAQAQLAKYIEAESKVLEGQSYMIGGRQLTRVNMIHIRDGIKYWSGLVQELSARASGRGRSRIVSPNW
ncbi:hypothetical protein ABO04_05045 [Nitrosomonas sp. HPC101]|uniref:DUF6148 family protein n=1 Tax=Nitrosomonas sp. HPC101 TaxID=1658667 RepID=UPI00136C8B1A|nr:DUF6148 family protein [Nitrosomonas sp. HPC101]MXS85301.1 hypothetical protein [Nitrosomonas sp. HPC101]